MPADNTALELHKALTPHSLLLRGRFAAQPQDKLPPLPDGQAASSVWLVGVVGSAFWPHFKASAFFNDGFPDPLDRWSRAIGEEMAARLGGLALFPFDGPPYHPFQRWADRVEATQTSPLMLRIHPHYGLWHAYRFALALPAAPACPAKQPQPGAAPDTNICANCTGQPCLQVCPVDAFTGGGYQLQVCAQHLHDQPQGQCMQGGCLARRACPEGTGFSYTPEHAAFHMQAFAKSH